MKKSQHRHVARRRLRKARFTSAIDWVRRHVTRTIIDALNSATNPIYYNERGRAQVQKIAENALMHPLVPKKITFDFDLWGFTGGN